MKHMRLFLSHVVHAHAHVPAHVHVHVSASAYASSVQGPENLRKFKTVYTYFIKSWHT